MQADTVRALRAAGIPVGSRHLGAQVGWTTSKETADKAYELGATLRPYTSPGADSSGWEIVVSADPPEEEDED